MEQTHGNIIISGLSLCLRILLSDIKFINGFLSILFFSLQSLGNWVSRNWKSCGTKKPRSYSSPEPQNHNLNLNFIQHGVRLCKEEVIVVMQKLGMSVERDGDGIEDFGEQEITQMSENEVISVEEVKEAFNVFDENKDGFIDAGELQRVLRCLGLERDFVQCQKMINGIDQNGDELIDHNEFFMLMEQSFC
ncbi:hypothetical protein AAZX31_20G031000 [Glycine max]|nr:uncharacterized protein LOC100526868 [Glycine max]KHN28802.1 Putative calcium-binding protein CML45 [Glycine soja]KAG4906513.1 hypothetical protein JHK86_054997 [Glycine max]KAG4917688.1 hypothetical protein JHK85_055969 [Glycine max]KAG5073786.1 hypothetical protein JHK84_055017 [Glycine max]KAG5076460.1 hypothetical protein JHK82_055155 [Glycine max]|eukprot:NP_001235262.2 uncharacterized protein LOC100526868 [Glycine max]